MDIIKRFLEKHGNEYNYSKVVYYNMTTKVCIICPIHGEFWQTPHAHLKGQGCPKCGVEKRSKRRAYTTEEFIEKAIEVHGDKYDYSKVVYKNALEKVCIICPEHGEFWQIAGNHLNGYACPNCKKETLKNLNKDSRHDIFLKNAKEKYGDKYDYSKTVYKNRNIKICIICPEHGEFWQTPFSHLQSTHGCPKCGENSKNEKHKQTTEQFIKKAKLIHGNKYSYEKTVYQNTQTPITITCPIHGDFQQMPYQHLDGCGCQKCACLTSKYEKEICDYIKTIDENLKIITNDRTLLNGYEIDIYLPEYNIAIEFNGLFWHSNAKKKNHYHIMKTSMCNEKNVKLIHLFEDEWVYNKNSCKKLLNDLIVKNNNTTEKIEVIDDETAKNFGSKNLLTEYKCGDTNIGLFNDNNLCDIISLKKIKKGVYEIILFGNNIHNNVKLLSYIENNFNITSLKVKTDLRFQSHKMFQDMGFEISKITQPSFYYVINDKRSKRKEKNKQYYKIYDCGQIILSKYTNRDAN